MLKQLTVNNFTVFSQETAFQFSDNLNVVIGENGTGKSHLIRLVYVIQKFISEYKKDVAKAVSERDLKNHLCSIFMPESLGRLASRVHGHSSTTVEAKWGNKGRLKFYFSTRSKERVEIHVFDYESLTAPPIFIPTKEILSIFPGFQAALETRELLFDATYLDLAKYLSQAPLKGPRVTKIRTHLERLENMLNGSINMQGGHFYLDSRYGSSSPSGAKSGVYEAPLMAEGFRKIGMLAHLLRNGSLVDKSCLIWDEPEANLNPRLIRQLAMVLYELGKTMQVFIATHNLFLLKELEILGTDQPEHGYITYTGLSFSDRVVVMDQNSELAMLSQIVTLDEELAQSDRFMRIEEE